MTTPDSNQNEPSKMKKLTIESKADDSIHSRIPRRNNSTVQDAPEYESNPPPPVAPVVEPTPRPERRRFQFLPAFWTIASIMSITVNIILLAVLLVLLQMLGRIQELSIYGTDQVSGLLGGLYTNFVKMDQASIRTSIHVEKEIPVQFSLNVSGPTNVTLSQPVTIRGATVGVQTGGLTIRDANATIILPAGVVLPINIENLVVPVDQKVPAVLDVPVDIPLNQTELHEPFVGLQKVVEPWYCLIQPNATVNGLQVCVPDPTLVDPSLRTPIPEATVLP
jgi:hypothetical protein